MAIALVSTGTWTENGPGANTIEIPPPASIVDDNLLVMIAMYDDNQDITTPEAGWTKVGQITNLAKGDSACALFIKKASGESGDYTVNVAGTTGWVQGYCFQLSGQDQTTPQDQTAIFNSDSDNHEQGTVNPTAIVTQTDGAWVFTVVSGVQGDGGALTQPTNYTLHQDNLDPDECGVAYRMIASAGSETPDEWSGLGTGFDGGDFLFAIKPAAGEGGAVINRVLTETTVITDPVPGSILKKERASNSNVELFADTVFLHLAHARLVQDNFDIEDQFIIEQELRRALSNALTPQDTVQILRKSFRELSDIIAISDNLQKTVTVGTGATNFRTVGDGIGVRDETVSAKLGIHVIQLMDSLSVNEAEVIDRLVNRSFADQVAMLESMLMEHSKYRRDNVSVTDDMIVTRAARLNSAVIADTISLVDFIDKETGTLLPISVCIDHGIEVQ
jgi:hypothetical protein